MTAEFWKIGAQDTSQDTSQERRTLSANRFSLRVECLVDSPLPMMARGPGAA